MGIAVIGAGITGLTAADHLVKAGRSVRIFDKGRGSGGRIATRRTPNGVFDHGAPELHARSDAFRAYLAELGAVEGPCGSSYGAPGMRSIFDGLIDGLDIRQGVEVESVSRESRGWVVRLTNGRSLAPFHSVIVTAPAPQAKALIASAAPEIASEIEKVRMQTIWTCLVEFQHSLELPGRIEGQGSIMRADRMASKPGREDNREAWVIHMTPDFAQDEIFADPSIFAPHILETFEETFALTLPPVRYLDAHRWRYAFADQPLGRPYLGCAETGLLVGGDWTLGRRAEHGFESGKEMAKAMLSREVLNV